jgi:hypothetical protein
VLSPIALGALPAGTDDVTRDSARQAAERELIKPEYHHVKPLMVRAYEWLFEHLARLISQAAEAAPGGAFGLAGIVLVLVGIAVLVRYRLGPLASSARRQAVFDPTRPLTAAEHRATAVAAADAADWVTAVRERFRALVRELEERGLVEPRAGRTADEAVAEVAALLPAAAQQLRQAATWFDDIVYGGRTATQDSYRTVAAADDIARESRPVLA